MSVLRPCQARPCMRIRCRPTRQIRTVSGTNSFNPNRPAVPAQGRSGSTAEAASLRFRKEATMNIQLFRAIRPSNVRSANRTKSKTLMLLTAITVLATLPISVGLSAQQKFTSIDVPGATFTDASGINPRGDIVGLYFDTSGNRHGFC